jgi:ABC-type antimicrobial peptide transport system permease subunit
LQSFVYGVAPLDVASLGGALGVLVMAAAIAAFFPIWRATRIDPMILFRGRSTN